MILARGFENLVWGVRAAGLAGALVMASAVAGGAVELAFPAFKQAVAEAAAPTRDIAAFYRDHEFAAVWTGPDAASRARRAALIEALGRADLHGLPKDRYDPDRLLEMLAAARGPRARAEAEVALSKAFVNFARDLQSGVLDPASIDEGIKRHRRARDAAVYLTVISGTDRPRSYLRTLAPRTLEYRALVKEKLRLEEVIAQGGWGSAVPAGALEPGDSGAAVVALRERLRRMGYLGRSMTMTYDDAIAEAVRRFQRNHGLSVDGKAGSATIAEINRPPEARLRSVIVAMERERWLPRERGTRFVRVNITDFSARMFDNGRIVYESRSVVGANAHDRRTPEFSDTMEHMIINPRWNVPRSIAVKEYLPQMQANPGAAGHLRLYRGGREVSRAGIDFSAYTAQTFPFDLKQPPSKGNALGLVKFMFPNKYNIYLHDTPSKHLFARTRRAYSHGCIRLQKPFEFAYRLLSYQEENPKAFFQRILRTGQETQVDLETPLPIDLIYRTAFVDARGEMEYRADVYGRDAKIWNALMGSGVTSVAAGAGFWEPRAPQPSAPPRTVAARAPQRVSQPAYVREVRVAKPRARSRRTRPSHADH